jgi:acyl-CoA thioesterase I
VRMGAMAAALAILVLLFAAGCGMGQAGQPAPRGNPAPTSTPPVRVLFVGASVTAGKYASSASASYVDLVMQSLDTQRWVSVTRLATSGATTKGALLWNVGVPNDIAVVQMGTNDYVNNVPLEEFGREYGQLLGRIRTRAPGTTLLCVSTWADPTLPNRAGISGSQYDQVMKRVCAAKAGHYVDISGVYMDPANHGPEGRPTFLGPGDLFHPNDRGHSAIAFAVLTALASWHNVSGGGDTAMTSPATRSTMAGG